MAMSDRDRATAVVRKLHDIWNTGRLDELEAVYAPDFVAHFPARSEFPVRRGLEGVVFGIERIRRAFPDWYEDVRDLLVDGDRVATRYVSTGTHQGDFWGIAPTGKRIEIDEMSIYRIENGRVAEQWCHVDELARLMQLGARVERGGGAFNASA